MPAKKKTNYVSYEIKKLEAYFKQLTGYLDKNPPDKAKDRIEIVEVAGRAPIIKLISKKEDQVKLFMEMLQKMPGALEDLNRLRKSVDGEETKDIRGGHGMPGFMTSSKEEVGEYHNTEQVEISEDGFDDDEEDNKTLLLLKGTDEEVDEESNEVHNSEQEEEEIEDEDPEWDDED